MRSAQARSQRAHARSARFARRGGLGGAKKNTQQQIKTQNVQRLRAVSATCRPRRVSSASQSRAARAAGMMLFGIRNILLFARVITRRWKRKGRNGSRAKTKKTAQNNKTNNKNYHTNGTSKTKSHSSNTKIIQVSNH